MTRKQLEDLGLTKEQADGVIRINGDDIENVRGELKNLQAEAAGYKQQIADRDKQLETLKATAGDNEALAKQIADLQAENTTAKEAHESELNRLKVDFAVEKALTAAKAKNQKAVRALLELDDAAFDKDGNVKGLSEQIEKLAAADDTKFLFEETQQSFKGFQPGVATTVPDSKQAGYESRLADARKNNNTLEVIKIKQEAYENGVALM